MIIVAVVTRLLMLSSTKNHINVKLTPLFYFFSLQTFPLRLFSSSLLEPSSQLYCHLYTFLTYLLKDYFNYLTISNKKKVWFEFLFDENVK